MNEKTYDIVCDSNGWSCRVNGVEVASFPSWALALGAAKASAEKERRQGTKVVLRYQDLKGTMHTLDPSAPDADQPPINDNPAILSRSERSKTDAMPH